VTVSGTPSNAVWFTVSGTSVTGYRYRNSITIAHTKVPNTDQVNFPVLISGTYSYLATTGNGGYVTSSNGYDIAFASDPAGLNALPFEQESYNPATGAVIYWVQVPTLSHTSDTVIYMFSDNPGITTSQANRAVWDGYYKAVWHLDQNPTGTAPQMLDSTTNANNATAQGTWSGSAQVSGQIGGSLIFTSANSDYLSTANSFNNPGTETVQAWFKSTSTSGKIIGFENAQTGTGSTTADRHVWLGTDGKVHGGLSCTYPGSLTSGSTYNDGNWHQAALTLDVTAQQAKLYVDGAQAASTSCSGAQNFNGYYRIGSYQLIYWNNATSGYFNGSIDEARISLTARSGDWIATEYNNQSSPSTFFSVSSQVELDNPIVSSVSPTAGAVGASITISGAGFGSSQGTSTVSFNGTNSTATAWSSTSITVPVPSGASTGNLVVTVSALPSNPTLFTVNGALSGTVTNYSGGTPISGATVQVLQNQSVVATTTTASNGTYSVTGIVTGEYDVKFSASGFGTVLQAAESIPAAGTTLNQVLNSSYGTISGQITQSNGTTAISGATVTVLQSSEIVGSATSNGSGNYSVSPLGAGSYEVEVSAGGYVSQGQESVSVTAGSTTTENFSLDSVGTQPISYVYDQLGRLSAAIDQAGNVAVYSYDAVGNILSISRGSAQQLSVLTFSPSSAAVGSTITIYGTAFSPTASLDTVKFNGTTATVISASVSVLTVTVPSGATTGAISVTTSAGTVTSGSNFTVVTSGAGQPTISSFTPSIGTPGTSVSISGTNFETTSTNDRVKFNTGLVTPSTATATSLSVSVPSTGTSGHLVITTPAGTNTSTGDFFVPPGSIAASAVGYTNRMSLGGNLTVTISTAGNVGLIVFDGTAGHRLSLLTSSNTMTSSGGSTVISVYRPDGYTVATQTVTTSAPFIGPQRLSMTGTYTILVQPSSSATGSINVAIYDVPADVVGSITVGGSSVPLTATAPGQVGTLMFNGTLGQQVTVHATSNSMGSVTVSLLDPTGNTVATQSSSSSSFNLSSATLAGSGTFSVSISPSQPNTGSITIALTSP